MFIASLLISALILVFYHGIKRTLPAKKARRLVLQEELRQFAVANREAELTSQQIERFWTQTRETYSLCRKTAISDLRNDLYTKSVLLLNTKRLLAASASDNTDQHVELMKLHAETVQWFSAALVEMDTLFGDEQDSSTSVQDVWVEFIRLICHSIRA